LASRWITLGCSTAAARWLRDHIVPAPDSEKETAARAMPARPGSAAEVLLAFLRLGLTSFGGPAAHIGYFRSEFVERRRWLDDRAFADLVALTQFLPGPASSQTGIALGWMRAGWRGALAAWVGFTAPSAIAMIVFALGIAQHGALAASGAVRGLKIVAVAIVAQAVWTMARVLCPDRPRRVLALLAALVVFALPSAIGQVAAIVACGLLGWRLLSLPRREPAPPHAFGVPTTTAVIALLLFAMLLIGLPLAASVTASPLLQLFDGFYRAGALVFGGGHVVLPLLQAAVVPGGAVSNADFLAGYGAAQAVPGPLFAFAAYLGAVMDGPLSGWIGGFAFLVAIFLPGALIVVGALPFWDRLRSRDGVGSAMAGINAGVVGILAAALVDPVFASGIHSLADLGLALAAFALLVVARVSPVLVVGATAVAASILST
jgi:chromate transporter